ncbi:hypothetical protein HHK36_032466 [Tetracentron sinense]|uniref:Uncharacterized protein n=1 Tax=Tetracentron sinense TaxID=13715 RepID=A0A834YA87_TETSI|nr:hypothetical protein HHK36_032466 [Tetracentron sinense]
MWYPSSLSYVGSSFSANGSSILAIAEGCQLSIWDLRVKENGGCVQRICGSIGDIFYAVCSSSSGAIAVGGADRTVTIYDPRRSSVDSGKKARRYFHLEGTPTGLDLARDVLGGWCDSGSIFVADIEAKEH